jgi:predicted RNase H-like nuclease (RuvC/YqgF family)
MVDTTDTTEQEREAEADDAGTETVEREDEAVIDVEAVEEQEADVEALQQQVEEQEARIEELEDLLLDLSVRVADDRAMGVCPDCHGAVVKKDRWLRRDTIECTRCGRVFHEY